MAPQKFPAFLEDAFNNGYSKTDSDGDIFKFATTDIGKLNIKDGKIIACDPICLYFEDPFEADFPIGEYPVELAIASINDDDQRIGFARIKFSDAKPVKWDFALTDGQDPADLDGDEYFGYGVDSGTGAFMDTSGYAEYEQLYKDEEAFADLKDQIEQNYKDTRSWLLWQGAEGNAALFSSGYGDGMFASYIGYDEKARICRLVTDFGLLEW